MQELIELSGDALPANKRPFRMLCKDPAEVFDLYRLLVFPRDHTIPDNCSHQC